MGVSCWADFETGGQWAPLYQQTTVAPWAQAGPSSGEPRAELVEVLTWAISGSIHRCPDAIYPPLCQPRPEVGMWGDGEWGLLLGESQSLLLGPDLGPFPWFQTVILEAAIERKGYGFLSCV